MSERAEELAKKHPRVRMTFDIPCMTAGATGPQTWYVFWIEEETDDYWATFDDGHCLPFRIPRKCIIDMIPA